jgi:hypothetical protein
MSNPAYVRSDNVNAVVYRGIDAHIHELALPRGGKWLHSDLTAPPVAAPAAFGYPFGYVRSDQVNAVVYPFSWSETDNHIQELALPLGGTAWQHSDLTPVAFPAALLANPFGYVRSDQVNAVVYRGTGSHIQELALPLGGAKWLPSDLTKLSSAPGAAGDPFGYVRSDQVNAVVYRGTDNHIHELALPRGGTKWLPSDLTKLSSAPAAAGDPFGYVRSDQVNAVVYRGTDNHIHELALPRGGTKWLPSDLTALSKSPAAAGDPFGYVRSDQVNAVVYRGTDNDIHEIALPRGGTKWLPSDLTALSGAPPAV